MAYVGARLKELRQARELTQDQLAERAGITRTDLSGIENNRISVGTERVARLAAALDVSVLELVPREAPREEYLSLERRLGRGEKRAADILANQRQALAVQKSMLDRLEGIEAGLQALAATLESLAEGAGTGPGRTRRREAP